jgi:hypothetical protein
LAFLGATKFKKKKKRKKKKKNVIKAKDPLLLQKHQYKGD